MNAETTERMSYTVILGYDESPNEADVLAALDANFSNFFGGATRYNGVGMWSEQGAEFTTSYGNIKTEKATVYRLLTMGDSDDMDKITESLGPAKTLGCEWVHVERASVEGLHIQL